MRRSHFTPPVILSASKQTAAALQAAVIDHLGAQAPHFAIDWIEECASTNTALIENTPADEGRVHVLVAERQSAGRGRRGRQWQSWPEGSLTFSSVWHFARGTPAPAGLSLVAGVAVACALERFGVVGLQLKWPNDVLVNGEKLVGILVELSTGRARGLAAVIGIGINLRLPPDVRIDNQAGVTDLARAIDGELPSRPALLAALLTELERLFTTYASGGFPALKGAWEQRNAFAELPVRISGDDAALEGICAGVDDDGALLLRTATGMQRILAGDVSLRPLGGTTP
jgi:BirA family biotin operon repressor/biotin-[acetyl-CoA-carboxylase] ligase